MALTGLTNLQPLHIKTVGIGTFDNAVSIGGTLTYEDVTNVDSLGIGTFRAGINVSGGQLDVGSNIKIGNAGIITATELDISGDIDVDGHTNLDNVSIAGVSTVYGHGEFGSTVDIAGDLAISDTIRHIGDSDTKIRFPAADTVSVETAGSERLRIISSGEISIGGFAPTASAGILQIAGGLRVAGSASASDTTTPYIYRTSGVDNLNFATSGSERMVIDSAGQVTIGGEVHIGSKLVHDGDTDTHINFSSNTIVTTAGNVTKMNVNNTMVEINGVVQRQGGRQYQTNSTSTWQTILSFSNASANGFFFECAVSENNYSTIYKVGGSPNWNSCYFTSDHAGDSNHAHSSDIEFRVLNDSGTKRLQFKAISYTTTRYLIAINVWVRSGYVIWS